VFRGRHDHTIDAKGRLSIPRVFRGELVAGEDSPPMLVSKKDHLALYPGEIWAAQEQKLLAKSSLDPDTQNLLLFFGAGSQPTQIDQQGRVNVPPFMRENASLESKVIIVGAYNHIQVWNPSRLEQKLARTVEDFDDIQRRVDQAAGS
jgi:MraZ protein